MERKKELLDHYVDYCFRNIKYFFPTMISMFDVKKIKEDIDINNRTVTEKNKIDDIFKTNLTEYLNTKFNFIKNNETFVYNRHEDFDFDYEVADKILWFHNYTTNGAEIYYPELRDDYGINDCKEVVFDFYKDLLGDNPNDIEIIKNILNNKINIIFNKNDRPVTNGDKEIDICFRNDLCFLMALVHEMSHAFAFSKTNIPIEYEDVRNMEAESLFIEKLFLKYLNDRKLPIFKDDAGARCINNEDLEKYFLVSYLEIISNSIRILDEKDIINTINDDNIINKDFLDDYNYNNPYEYHYIVQASFVNEIFDDYLIEELKNLDYYQLKEIEKYVQKYSTKLIDSYEGHIRYLLSGILSCYFVGIFDDKRQIDSFKDFIRQKRDYSCEELAFLFNIELDDALAIITDLYDKFKKIAPKYNIEVTSNPKIQQEYFDVELSYYKKLVEQTKKCDNKKQDEMKIVKKMFDLFDAPNVGLNMYPFEINYQLDDCDVEKYEDYKKKILRLRKSDN